MTASNATHPSSGSSGPGSLRTVARPPGSSTIAVERISPGTGTPCSVTPSSAIIAAAARPVWPGMKPTSDAGACSSKAARATLRPLPPGVTATSSTRRTSPGRSSASREVRSIVRFGPAMITQWRHWADRR